MSLQFPPIYLLPTRLQPEELHQLEEKIPSITHNTDQAVVFLGKVSKKERALFELRKLKVSSKEAAISHEREKLDKNGNDTKEPTAKRQKVDSHSSDPCSEALSLAGSATGQTVKVVKLAWYTDSLARNAVLPFEDYLVYNGIKVPPESLETSPEELTHTRDVLSRAAGDLPSFKTSEGSSSSRDRKHALAPRQHPPTFAHATTSEHEAPLPQIPESIRSKYACQRSTPIEASNEAFVQALKDVRLIRRLQGDSVGERAYGSALAVIAAYPYPINSASEVAQLPGCGTRLAELWQRWNDTAQLKELVDADSDAQIQVLKLFYEIWGVGDITAREYYKKGVFSATPSLNTQCLLFWYQGWRDLDDIVEYGWSSLSRVQQIGIKFYDEFQLKMTRSEVGSIGEEVLSHARRIDKGFQMVVVGGYRRGKQYSGDGDILLSHPDESQTLQFITKIVKSLEKANLITHTLILSTKSSERGQTPLPWKGAGRMAGGGFDTLDKALVVWQDHRKPHSPHRRVDIIISPWRTVGCAVLGWSGGNTFERDLRLYCKQVKGWKFDSSGIRRRDDGSWVDLEGNGSAPDMLTAERRVFDGLGLEYRAPEERCTG